MSKIDDYKKLRAEIESGMKCYHLWCEADGDGHYRGGCYFIQAAMDELEKTGGFFSLLEAHLNKRLEKARFDAEVEASEFVRDLNTEP